MHAKSIAGLSYAFLPDGSQNGGDQCFCCVTSLIRADACELLNYNPPLCKRTGFVLIFY